MTIKMLLGMTRPGGGEGRVLAVAMTEAGNRRVTPRVLPGPTYLFTSADASEGMEAAQVSPELLKTLREWITTALPAK